MVAKTLSEGCRNPDILVNYYNTILNEHGYPSIIVPKSICDSSKEIHKNKLSSSDMELPTQTSVSSQNLSVAQSYQCSQLAPSPSAPPSTHSSYHNQATPTSIPYTPTPMTSPLFPATSIQPHPLLSPSLTEQSQTAIMTPSGEACNNNNQVSDITQDSNKQSIENQTTDHISSCMLYLSPPPTKSVPSISPFPSPVFHTATISPPSPQSLLPLDKFSATYAVSTASSSTTISAPTTPVTSAFLPDVFNKTMELRKRTQVDYKNMF